MLNVVVVDFDVERDVDFDVDREVLCAAPTV